MLLLGRESELAVCDAVLCGGQFPVGLVVTGEPGIGKTAFCRAVVDRAVAGGWRVLSSIGLCAEAAVPLANLADLLGPVAGEILRQLPSIQRQVLRGLLLQETPARVDDAVVARATVNALRAAAGHARLLIAIDDAQWLDADTTRLLSTATAWLTDLSVGWLVAVRGDQTGPGLAQAVLHELGPRCDRLHLCGLSEPLLARLVLDRFPGRLSPGLLRRIVELGAGNPYTTVELARETIAAGGRDAAAVLVSGTLAESLRARIRRLPPAALAVVQICALTPRPNRRMLRVMLDGNQDAAVDEAIEVGILDARPPDPVLRFTHPLLRDTARNSLSAVRRRRLHRGLAAVVEDPVEVAGHLAAGAEEPDEQVARTVVEGAGQAWLRGAPAQAAALLRSAIALCHNPHGLMTWELRLKLLDCLDQAGEYEQARTIADEWAATVPVEFRGELTHRRGLLMADYEEGQKLLAQAMEELRDDPERAAWVGADLAVRASGNLQRFSEGRPFAEQAVRHARTAGNPVLLRRALSVWGDLASRMGDPDAGAVLREAVALPASTDSDLTTDYADLFLAFWFVRRGELDPAREIIHRLFAEGVRLGQEETAKDAQFHLAELEWTAGHWAEADRHAQAGLQRAREIGDTQAGSLALIQARSACGYGQVEDARAIASEGIRAADEQGDAAFSGACRQVLGRLELSVDSPAAAVTWLEPAVRRAIDVGAGDPSAMGGVADLIEAYARVGRTDEATDLLKTVQEAAIRLDHPWGRITGGRAAAVLHLARGAPALAVDAVTPAAAEARHLGLPLELGRCLLVLGTAQRRTRRRRDAAATLDEAITVFEQLGAPCWTTLARDQRDRLAHAALDILTPTEQRIADLVAHGYTNAEIAAALLIKVKTVEGTLTRIYRKLGMRSRIDLARRAAT
jgi:DNA-binding CsgD family transcriptional regulator